MSAAAWPDRLEPHQVSSGALGPLVIPLMANVRASADYIGPLRDLLLDLTVRMARKHTSWYAALLPQHSAPISRQNMATLPLLSREQISDNRQAFVADVTTFAFCTFTGGTTKRVPLMVERCLEEQTYLAKLMRAALSGHLSGPRPAGLVAVNGSHGEVFQVPGHGFGFSINFEQPAAYRKCAWLLQQELQLPGVEPRITFIQGYFEFIHLLVLYLREQGITLPPGQVRSIACYGMAIPSERRAEVESYFGTSVSDNFSLSEIHGSAPHSPIDASYVYGPFVHAEVVDVDSGAPITQGSGELVLTSLFPFTQRFPLIRYRTGDLVFTPGAVDMGPLFQVRGRLIDAVSLAPGRLLTPGDVTLALEPLSFVARLPGFTRAVRQAGRAAGPRFVLTGRDGLPALLQVEVAAGARSQLPSAVLQMEETIRARLIEQLPSPEAALLQAQPGCLELRLSAAIDRPLPP